MRLASESVASSGMARVITVAIAPMAANSIARKRVSWIFSMMRSIMMRSQKSKLIILRMTMTPVNIQTAQPASIRRPVGWVQSSSMYCGLVI